MGAGEEYTKNRKLPYIYVGKTKGLISFAVTAKLICVFVFAYAKHWFSHEAAHLSYPGEDIVFLATDINLPGAVDWVMMQSCFGHHFMLVLEKQEKMEGQHMFYAIVQLIGTRKQAESFAYRLDLSISHKFSYILNTLSSNNEDFT